MLPRLSKSGFYIRSKGDSKIEKCKIAIKIEGFYSTTFEGSKGDSKIEKRKIAIKIKGF